ncbi:MAG: hypothetical protein HY519_00850 [Candidatus Aenigmarchaeota archaeon]|nr:hypothetical protein [Candidatus Aenigmarchaeota archaeon]
MAEKLFPAQEIGSLAKPVWHVKKIANRATSPHDLQLLCQWAGQLAVSNETVSETETLLAKQQLTAVDKERMRQLSSIFVVKLFEQAGLDYVYNGEQTRVEMYQHPITYTDGFKFYGEVRSFDNKYYLKAACVGQPQLQKPYHTDEFNFVKTISTKQLKVPITGAYTLADWSFNEHYLKRQPHGNYRQASREAKRELALDLARDIIRPNIKSLVEAGCSFIQIDEPAAATHPDDVPLIVESFNESVKGIGCRFSVHICFSDYQRMFPHIMEMKKCGMFTWEFANRDDNNRAGYKILELFREHNYPGQIGLGVFNVHNDEIEQPELIRDRILFAAKTLGDPAKVYVNPDCGLRTRTWEVAFAKLQNMVAGAALARQEFG